MSDPIPNRRRGPLADDPLWYKDAVLYELHVKSFFDSNGDGIGDFPGLTSRLDYLQELGVTALWLLPFYPSPQRDDGYDIAEYMTVNPTYGTLDDFQRFLAEAHRRGLRVITELVINHTSDQHPWFQRARTAPRGSPERDFYVWTDDPTKYKETRIIFKDYEPSNWTWDPVAQQYYWHRFFHHQPDLNFDNPAVHELLFQVMDHWFAMGVDGMRLDAIPYLFEREGTNCENLPETHVFLKRFRQHLDSNFQNRMLLAEANQWPEDAAQYFGDGDECHMNFHFPIMPRLFMSLRMEDRFPIVDILEQTPQIPPNAQWAIFLRNHDELTLEMVTDEERDYMYRVYAHEHTARINLGIRRRLAPLLDNARRKIELMNSLLFALPGTPVLYYGDEIGMGDNFYLGDRHGVRTPMQWSGDRNAGFSAANPQKLFLPVIIDPEYHFQSVNVDAQQGNPSSMLWWMRRVIALRRRHQAFGRGTLEWVNPENRRVIAFVREHAGERILVVVNLSRFTQAADLDLSRFAGSRPIEMFGHAPFPKVEETPYRVTLGPHNFIWLLLSRAGRGAKTVESPEELPVVEVAGAWQSALGPDAQEDLEPILIEWIKPRRWFAGKAKEIRRLQLGEWLQVTPLSVITVAEVTYVDGDPERYLLPLGWSRPELPHEAGHAGASELAPGSSICRIAVDGGEQGVLHEASADPAFGAALLSLIREGTRARGGDSELIGVLERAADLPGGGEGLRVRTIGVEQSNTSLVFDDRWILKLFRRIEEGGNLDREIGGHLTELRFPHVPEQVGALEYRSKRLGRATAGLLQAYAPNQGDAWAHTQDALGRHIETALAAGIPHKLTLPGGIVAAARAPLPADVHATIEDTYLEMVRLIGRRTAEMHQALAAPGRPGFEPEPFGQLYQRSLYQSMRNLLGHTLRTLEQAVGDMPHDTALRSRLILASRGTLLSRFRALMDHRIDTERIRTHGDYHLGQLLFNGKDFLILDFEGEPNRPVSERRLKRSPLRDVASMLRSFHYAVAFALMRERERAVHAAPELDALDRWGRFWHTWVGVSFLHGYLEAAEGTSLIPADDAVKQLMLDAYLLEKALYELGYELANRPAWVRIPVEGILDLLGETDSRAG
jgi:maltose alpha-D-glucosyltransferase / alpha-amylase